MSITSLRGKVISYDTETTGLNPWNSLIYKKYNMKPARPFAFAFRDLYGNSAYIRWDVDPTNRHVCASARDIKDMSEILGDPDIVKIGHNLAFDIRMTRLSGIKFDWTRIHDTMIMAHVIKGGVSGEFSFNLKVLGKAWFDIPTDDEGSLLESVRKNRQEGKAKGWAIANNETHGEKYIKSDYWLGDKELVKTYAMNDTERALLIYLGIINRFKRDELDLYKVYKKTEIPLLRVVYRMEAHGVRCYPEKTAELKAFYEDYVKQWRIKADKLGAKGINFNSPLQLRKLFCDELGHITARTTQTGQPSIDADELLRLSQKEPIAKAILECKAGQSMINKFLNAYEKFRTYNEVSLVHPSFHQVGTRTARFSSSDPNFQQLASPDSVKKKADVELRPREAFGPRKGNFWFMPDYSQMEVWVFAFAAKDPILMKALLSGKDIHEAVGKMMWGKRTDWAPGKTLYRKKGKTIMFLKQYGGGAPAYMIFTDCDEKQAYSDLKLFDTMFPGVNKFINEITNAVSKSGVIVNPFGRQATVERTASYTGINYLIQGTCADIMKRAMVRLDRRFQMKYKREVKLVLTVHDELAIEAPKRLLHSELYHDIIEDMQKDSKLIGLPVSLPVSMKMTLTTWANAKEFNP